jgi:peptidoglycan/xylan/chitin deacetylase (PgdA/CDA1 family)
MAIDQDGSVSYVSVYKSGNTYMVPADIVCRRLGITYSRYDSIPLIRFVTSPFAVSDADFLKKLQSSEETPPPATPAETPKGGIYLTFDNAPGNDTERILDILDKYNVKATFFVTETAAAGNPKTMSRIIAAGHTVGINGASYAISENASKEDILRDANDTRAALFLQFKISPFIPRR